jgi:uncharacterized protein DUF1761
MSFDALNDLNWLAVIVAALAYYALGAAWYAPPVLGKAWMRSIGMDTAGTPPSPSPAVLIVPFFAQLIEAIAMGMLAAATLTDTLGEGIVLGLVAGVGVSTMIVLVTATFETKPEKWTWFAITAGYHLVGLLIVGAIVGAWT